MVLISSYRVLIGFCRFLICLYKVLIGLYMVLISLYRVLAGLYYTLYKPIKTLHDFRLAQNPGVKIKTVQVQDFGSHSNALRVFVADCWTVFCIFNSRFDLWVVLGESGVASSGHFRVLGKTSPLVGALLVMNPATGLFTFGFPMHGFWADRRSWISEVQLAPTAKQPNRWAA